MTSQSGCVQCHETCATCTEGLDEFACSSCNSPNILDSGRKNCYFDCGDKKYKELPIVPLDDVCFDCHITCTNCIGPLNTDCISCPLDNPLENPVPTSVYTYSGTISSEFTSIGECIQTCATS